MDLRKKTVTVVGLGNSGVNAGLLLERAGAIARATDAQATPAARETKQKLEERGIKVEIGGHTEGFIKGSDLIVVSPGVEGSSPAVKWALESGIPIISEMELGYRFCKGRIIAVTGTNGKTTVTTLIGRILADGAKDAVVCGNIGNSLCGEIPRIKEDTWVVLEVSSFQLERIEKFRPNIAVILNITDDHMDRYGKFGDYFSEKTKIFRNQGKDDILILNYDARNLPGLAGRAQSKVLFYSRQEKTNGAYLAGDEIWCEYADTARKVCPVGDIKLKGLHNVENVLACCLVGSVAGVKEDSIRNTIAGFATLAHRFETVDIIDGIEYVDDSKGTTVDSTYRALESCEKKVILIAGGKDKHSDYGTIREMLKKKVAGLILIGEAKPAIKRAIRKVVPVYEAKDMTEAVRTAHGLAKRDYIVLLSPMCSSFDMFKDYKERGEVFKEAARKLKSPKRCEA